ncbi:hypothetical protein NKOR_07180 [Candidatus Nitrosopumilus koreensis AR1]|uniref:Uncharacterized protein n=1 Tax=Candidatus Nitrosopumilus koreensis AR1 TaxID=1229908 RepID=K0B555_9ARCH|nr:MULTISPECIES: hypothetical protein [Nitrosopumilus]AFS81303.1 hypothetical protein NKOR_07180 [Candidatus Nitrosopumilus koreensis AR1]
MRQFQSERLRHLPNGNSLLKISLGLIFFTIISSAFVYAETMSVDVDGTPYDFEYTAKQVEITSVTAETLSDSAELLFGINVIGDSGELNIIFERTFFDSIYDGEDDPFFVIVDGLEADFSETTTAQSRTLNIKIPAGSEDLEIIGTVFGQTLDESSDDESMVDETTEKQIPASFVDSSKDTKYYVERYVTEPSYKKWFEDNYSDYTFHEALDISKSELDKLIAEIEEEQSESTVETPVETPVDTPKETTECGEGTILKDGVCVLDERCGSGTVLKDGMCVVEPKTSVPKETSFKGLGKELGYGVMAAFIITGAVAIILALMSKASKSSD